MKAANLHNQNVKYLKKIGISRQTIYGWMDKCLALPPPHLTLTNSGTLRCLWKKTLLLVACVFHGEAACGSDAPADLTFYSAWLKRKVTGWRGNKNKPPKLLSIIVVWLIIYSLRIEYVLKCPPWGHLDFLFMICFIFQILHYKRMLYFFSRSTSSFNLQNQFCCASVLYCCCRIN